MVRSNRIPRLFHFIRGFPFPFANFPNIVSSNIDASMNDRDKQMCLPWLAFPRKSWSIVNNVRRTRCPIGLRFQEAR